jgi:hypothetical protein
VLAKEPSKEGRFVRDRRFPTNLSSFGCFDGG